ncbi:MAG: TetR/AcrR family transcriptional regulator [Micrococcales bacterium]|nr:TetR/AcrR family transcriptional regulator [Micrococcales bacterium]
MSAVPRSRAATTAKPYHHGDLRHALIEAGIQELKVSQAADLSLRALAGAVGVSHAAAYRHFADRDDLLVAIAQEGFAQLTAAVESAADAADDPVTALRSAARAYLRFGTGSPNWLALMFSPMAANSPDLIAAQELSVSRLLSRVGAAQAARRLPDAPAQTVALLAWTVVHGLTTLASGDQLGDEFAVGPADPEHQLDLLLELAGL